MADETLDDSLPLATLTLALKKG